MIKKQIPNTITLLNLLCGVVSIIFLFEFGNPFLCSIMIILGAVFDFFDGMLARLLKVSSPIGKELDSLSDVVTFGVAPSLIAFFYVRQSGICGSEWLCFVPLLMAMMSSFRLAKFNLDERQTSSFIGLPTPANALLWLSIPLMQYAEENSWYSISHVVSDFAFSALSSPYFILPFSLIMSVLLVCELPMFSLKFHNLQWQSNKVRFLFLILSVLLLIGFNVYAIPMILVAYILISILVRQKNTLKTC